MTGQFKIGDRVIMQHATYYEEYDGAEAVITEVLAPRSVIDMRTLERPQKMVYGVKILVGEGCDVRAYPWQLRKKDDPMLSEITEEGEDFLPKPKQEVVEV